MNSNLVGPFKATIATFIVAAGLIFANTGFAKTNAAPSVDQTANLAADLTH